jgi:hypothetical protein
VRTFLLDVGGRLREGDTVLARFQAGTPEALGQILTGGNRYDIDRQGQAAWHVQLLDADGLAPRCEFLPFHHRRGGKLVSENATFTLKGDGFWRPAGWVLECSEGWHLRAAVRAHQPARGRRRGLEEMEKWRTERVKGSRSLSLREWEIAIGAGSAQAIPYEVRLAGSSLPNLSSGDILAIAFASWLVVKWAEAVPLLLSG